MRNLTLLIDTREQMPLPFKDRHLRVHLNRSASTMLYRIRCKTARLVTGDYTFEGYEHHIAVETKRSPLELSENLLTADFKRASKAFSRFAEVPYSTLVCEFSQTALYSFDKGRTLDALCWLASGFSPNFTMLFTGPRTGRGARDRTADFVLRLMIAQHYKLDSTAL